MFGNKNAGLHETLARLGIARHTAKPKKPRLDAVIPELHRSLDPFEMRETYFAVGSPIRWKQ